MRLVADEGKTGYKIVDLDTGKRVMSGCSSLLELVEKCSPGDVIYTEQSRQNFKLEEREATNALAKSKGVVILLIPTRAIKIDRFDHNEGKAEGKMADLVDARRLARVVKSGIQTLPVERPHDQKYYDLLNDIREKAKDRTVVLRRTQWKDTSLLSILPMCQHTILSGGQKRKLKFKVSRVLPLVIAAQEVIKTGRGYKIFEGVIGNFGAGYPNLFRSNINYHWIRAVGTERIERKAFFKELRPALKWIFQEVKKFEESRNSDLAVSQARFIETPKV